MLNWLTLESDIVKEENKQQKKILNQYKRRQNNMVRYDELVNTVEYFVNNHNYFKGFGHGSIEYIDAAVNRGYPLLFMRPLTSPGLTGVDGRQRELTFEGLKGRLIANQFY